MICKKNPIEYYSEKVRIIENYYLIDYENVHSDGLTGCEKLGKADHIIIFFTQNATNLDMREIADHGSAELNMIEVPSGKQSADMHIVSYLGYLAGKNGKNCNVVIVSRDTDFDNVVAFWKDKTGIRASREQQIKKKAVLVESSDNKKTAEQKTRRKISGVQKTKFNTEIMQTVRSAGYDASVANTAAQIASGFLGDEHMLSEVHNALRDRYVNYLEVYNAAKPVLSKYAETMPLQDVMTTVSAKEKTAINTKVMQLLSKAGYVNDIAAYVASTTVKNYGAKDAKQQIYRAIISKYGQKKGLAIYNQIKKHI